MKVLICGGGVIGATIAYYLSRRGARAVVIERTDVACAASGKSGGFLALDWCDGTPLETLARRSFALHARLAEDVGEDWGYRRLDTFGGIVGFSFGQHHAPKLGVRSRHHTPTPGFAGNDRAGSTRAVHPSHDARGRSEGG